MRNQSQNQNQNQNQSQNQSQNQNQIQNEIQRLKEQFLHSSDFTAKQIGWGQGEQAILCFYSSLVKKNEVERYVQLLRLEHKKVLREQENKKKNDSLQSNNKSNSHQRISSNTKINDQKMIDISKNSDYQGKNNNKNQSEQNNAPENENQGSKGNDLKEQQKMDESSTNDNQGSNGSENQPEQPQNTNGQGSSETQNPSGQQNSSESTKTDSQGSNNNEDQTEQSKNSESAQNTDSQRSSNQVKQSDIQNIIDIQKNITIQSSSDIQAIIEQQKKYNANQNKSNNGNNSGNQSTSQNGENQKKSNSKEANTAKQQKENKQASQVDSMTITTETYDQQKIVEYICNGETIIILPNMHEIIRVNSPEFPHRSPDEPENEQILRGAHEGLVEHIDSNLSLIRKRIKNNKLIVKSVEIGNETKTGAFYMYLDDVVDQEALKTVEERLQSMNLDMYYSIGQLMDHLDDNVWSPFPQLLNTERPDRVVANILEGKIAVMTDISPTAIIGPVTFFSFYQSPDDFNSRVIVGTFYRILRMVSLLTAIFLPAIYIAVVSFHFEVIPLELANKVKQDINQIPYRPLFEALIMEVTIELIREASVRLPKSIGQTIGIVGGLVIGESIVSAGLVSNLMVIVVAFTTISSFVVPSIELNTAIRVLRFPFMLLASIFGFFGIMIGTFIMVIHLLNLSSLKQPYFSPLIPFQPKELRKVFIRAPYYRANKQVTSFSPKKDDQA